MCVCARARACVCVCMRVCVCVRVACARTPAGRPCVARAPPWRHARRPRSAPGARSRPRRRSRARRERTCIGIWTCRMGVPYGESQMRMRARTRERAATRRGPRRGQRAPRLPPPPRPATPRVRFGSRIVRHDAFGDTAQASGGTTLSSKGPPLANKTARGRGATHAPGSGTPRSRSTCSLSPARRTCTRICIRPMGGISPRAWGHANAYVSRAHTHLAPRVRPRDGSHEGGEASLQHQRRLRGGVER